MCFPIVDFWKTFKNECNIVYVIVIYWMGLVSNLPNKKLDWVCYSAMATQTWHERKYWSFILLTSMWNHMKM